MSWWMVTLLYLVLSLVTYRVTYPMYRNMGKERSYSTPLTRPQAAACAGLTALGAPVALPTVLAYKLLTPFTTEEKAEQVAAKVKLEEHRREAEKQRLRELEDELASPSYKEWRRQLTMMISDLVAKAEMAGRMSGYGGRGDTQVIQTKKQQLLDHIEKGRDIPRL